jgi:hypothetical protein
MARQFGLILQLKICARPSITFRVTPKYMETDTLKNLCQELINLNRIQSQVESFRNSTTKKYVR